MLLKGFAEARRYLITSMAFTKFLARFHSPRPYLQFIPCEGATTLRSLAPRRLFLSSVRFSSSSTIPCANLVRRSVFSSACNYSSDASSSSSLQEENSESSTARVSVWWDFESCNLPMDVDVVKVVPVINAALRANGIMGTIEVHAFGDILQLANASGMNPSYPSYAGINFNHVPHGGNVRLDSLLILKLMSWVSENPPPAHLFFICGDKEYAEVFQRLRMENYNILLASLDIAYEEYILRSASTIMWRWNSLIKGEKLIGTHFNHPPDGTYRSWYGHFKGPIEDPFSTSKESTNLDTKSIVEQIKSILKSHPQGITLDYLRSELVKFDSNIDKEYYGRREFFNFLLSMPSILQIQTEKDGLIHVRRVNRKSPKPFEPSTMGKRDKTKKRISLPKLRKADGIANNLCLAS